MRKMYILIPVFILMLGAVGFYVSKHNAFAPVQQHSMIDGLKDDFFTDFNVDQVIETKSFEEKSAPSASNKISPLLPSWDFKGPEILQAQEAQADQERKILDKYALRFQALKQLANERLNILAGKALEEYKQDKTAGKLSKLEFAEKYYSAMELLQANLDRTFSSELDNMKSELQNAHASTQVVEQVRDEYKNSKEKFQQELMEKLN
ncbi:MAG: hypothetical protein ABFD08_18425, partial [Syntrophomonas sp.]